MAGGLIIGILGLWVLLRTVAGNPSLTDYLLSLGGKSSSTSSSSATVQALTSTEKFALQTASQFPKSLPTPRNVTRPSPGTPPQLQPGEPPFIPPLVSEIEKLLGIG